MRESRSTDRRARRAVGVMAGACACAALLIGPANAASGAASNACAAIAEPLARLACYDDQNRSAQPAADQRASEQPADATTTAGVSPTGVAAKPAAAEQSAAAESAPPRGIASDGRSEVDGAAASSDAFGAPQSGLFDGWAPAAFVGDRLESSIVAARRAPKQSTLFRLANDQIWMQNAPREVPIRPGDRITIVRGLVGGYVLRNEDGAATRVRRIK